MKGKLCQRDVFIHIGACWEPSTSILDLKVTKGTMNIPSQYTHLFACLTKRLKLNLAIMLINGKLVEHHGAGNIIVDSEIISI